MQKLKVFGTILHMDKLEEERKNEMLQMDKRENVATLFISMYH